MICIQSSYSFLCFLENVDEDKNEQLRDTTDDKSVLQSNAMFEEPEIEPKIEIEQKPIVPPLPLESDPNPWSEEQEIVEETVVCNDPLGTSDDKGDVTQISDDEVKDEEPDRLESSTTSTAGGGSTWTQQLADSSKQAIGSSIHALRRFTSSISVKELREQWQRRSHSDLKSENNQQRSHTGVGSDGNGVYWFFFSFLFHY